MSALSAMQDKTQHLENSLSAETRIKLDLFSALGDAKRQLEIAQGLQSGVGFKKSHRKLSFMGFFFSESKPIYALYIVFKVPELYLLLGK